MNSNEWSDAYSSMTIKLFSRLLGGVVDDDETEHRDGIVGELLDR